MRQSSVVRKSRETQITVGVGPTLRAKMDEAKRRVGEMDEPIKDAEIVRDALRMWAKEAPYALNHAEMWLLRASRQFQQANPDKWAGAMRGFAELAAGFTGNPNLEVELGAVLATIPPTERPVSKPAGNRGDIPATRKRKAS